ncbi:MAG: hypothetical protein R3D58_05165 [Saprospiraceae bacterium]|jgi:hypothetical protein|nr:hypothetical protein [Lewinellaceae bacterium]
MLKTTLPALLLALSASLAAQDCATMYGYFKEGVSLEYTNYNKKDKVEGVLTHRVSSLEEKSDTLIATINLTTTDAKAKQVTEMSYPMKCFQGVIYVDMRSMIPQQAGGQQSPQVELEMTGTDLTYPPDMQPGQTLPDAEMEMTMRMGGIQLMNNRYQIKNRKVEARESVTTAAGTYTCLKISYDFEYKLMGTRTMRSEFWYAPEVGMVKTVNYDRKGNVESRSELTKVEQ